MTVTTQEYDTDTENTFVETESNAGEARHTERHVLCAWGMCLLLKIPCAPPELLPELMALLDAALAGALKPLPDRSEAQKTNGAPCHKGRAPL